MQKLLIWLGYYSQNKIQLLLTEYDQENEAMKQTNKCLIKLNR